VFGVLGAVGGVVGWQQPYVSLVVLLIYVYIALHPWTLIVILQLLLLRYMVWQYVYRIWERSDDQERIKKEAEKTAQLEENLRLKEEELKKGHLITRAAAAGAAGVTTFINKGKGVLSGIGGKPLDPDERAHLNTVVRGLANTSLSAIGMKESLGYYQHMLGVAADGLQTGYELFQWKHPATTRLIFIGVLCTTVYSLFFPHKYLWLLIGGAVLTCRTIPFQLIVWLALGVVRYSSRAKHSANRGGGQRGSRRRVAPSAVASTDGKDR